MSETLTQSLENLSTYIDGYQGLSNYIGEVLMKCERDDQAAKEVIVHQLTRNPFMLESTRKEIADLILLLRKHEGEKEIVERMREKREKKKSKKQEKKSQGIPHIPVLSEDETPFHPRYHNDEY